MTSVFDAWSSCPESSANLALLAPPPGWELLATAPPAPPGAPPPAPPPAPLATALVDRAARHAVVLIRGSKGPEEWKPNFVYAQVPAPVLAAPGAEPPLVHEGSLSQFELVAPAPAPALERLAAERAVDHVTVAGVSLGGAVASLVASALQARVGTAAAGGAPPVVSAALFAPNAGGADFASAYSAQVNGRRLYFASPSPRRFPARPRRPPATTPSRGGQLRPSRSAWPYAPTTRGRMRPPAAGCVSRRRRCRATRPPGSGRAR
jgi:hypothetical protein